MDKVELEVLADLLAKATPGAWSASVLDQSTQIWSGATYLGKARDYAGDDAAAIVASVNFLRDNLPAIREQADEAAGKLLRQLRLW